MASSLPAALHAGRSLPQALRRWTWGSPLYSLALGRRAPRELRLLPADPWPGNAERGQAMLSGTYRFAGQTIEGEEPLWLPAGVSSDYVAALHGFDWLRDLRAVGGDPPRRLARRLVEAWIERFDRWHPLVWRPDVLGLRIAGWIAAHDFFCASADDGFRRAVFASLSRQHRHLVRAAPGDVPGAPRIAAIKGLIFGQLALPGAETRLPQSLRLLAREIDRQVLPDGGHASRCPATHLTVLRHLVDLRTALRASRVEVPETLQHAVDRMAPALRFFRHGDGGLALFHGADEGEAVMVDTVLAQADARGRPLKSARHSGFERVLSGRTLLLADTGAPLAGFQAGAHAAPLAVELSIGRERLVVNCGPWPGPSTGREGRSWKDALRGTAAHSTVTLDDTDAWPLAPDDPEAPEPARRPAVQVERHEADGATWIEACHDGYRHGHGLTHIRRLYVAPAGDDVRGEDRLTPVAPNGEQGHHRGNIRFAVRFHLHPTAQVSLVQGGSAALVKLSGGTGWRVDVVGGDLSVEESVYFGNGERRRSHQLVIGGLTVPEGISVKWSFRRERR